MARNRTSAQKTAAKNRALRRVVFGALNAHQVAELSPDGLLTVRAIDSGIGAYIPTSWQTIFFRILLRKGPFVDPVDANYLIQQFGLTRAEAYEQALKGEANG